MHWIPCNLPWSHRPSPHQLVMPPRPTAPAERAKERFGISRAELAHQLDQLRGLPNGEVNQVESLSPEVQQQIQEGQKFLNEMIRWEAHQPEWSDYHKACRQVLEEAAASERDAKEATFVGQGLNFPGVLVELDNGERVLLGHTDEEGTKDGHTQISLEQVVTRYMVLDVPGLEQVTEDVATQLRFRAANDFEEQHKLPDYEAKASTERWSEMSGMAACVRLGFRPCDATATAAAAARKALDIYLKAYTRVRDLTADGSHHK